MLIYYLRLEHGTFLEDVCLLYPVISVLAFLVTFHDDYSIRDAPIIYKFG